MFNGFATHFLKSWGWVSLFSLVIQIFRKKFQSLYCSECHYFHCPGKIKGKTRCASEKITDFCFSSKIQSCNSLCVRQGPCCLSDRTGVRNSWGASLPLICSLELSQCCFLVPWKFLNKRVWDRLHRNHLYLLIWGTE